MAQRRLPREVVARAKAAAELPEPDAVEPAVAPRRKQAAQGKQKPDAGARVREKVLAHLRRLHPMD
jgi:hypothetical protein